MREELQQQCARYVAQMFASEDDVLRQLRETLPESGLPEIQISAEEGKLLQLLLRAVGARRVLEIGTLGGYSAIWMTRALPEDGVLISLEIDATHAAFARSFIERAGLSGRVEVRLGDAMESLVSLEAEEPFDVVFIDADKRNYPFYLDWSVAHVRHGGLVIADNAFWKGRVVEDDGDDPDLAGIKELNRKMASDPRLCSIIVPSRDGVAIALVNGA